MRFLRQRILLVTAVLVGIGIVMIYSTSAIYARETYGDGAYFLKRHLVYCVIGILLSAWVLTFDPIQIRRWVKPFMGMALFLLVAVLVPGIGRRVSGASRWFRFGWISIQPSEIAHLSMTLYLADVLTRKRAELENFVHGVLPALVILGLTLVLVLIEPDMGTTFAIAMVSLALLFIAGVQWKLLLSMLLAGLPMGILLVIMKPYRVRRILGYLNPWADPEGAGFQLIQSLVALGSGGLLGVGLGASRQKLFYLPAAHTDFIFAVIGEELGFLGACAILVLIGALIWYGIRISLQAPDSFGVLTGLGILFFMALKTLVHVGVTTGAIPTKGLPLPFISYGGSALVIDLVSIAILLNVTRPRQEIP